MDSRSEVTMGMECTAIASPSASAPWFSYPKTLLRLFCVLVLTEQFSPALGTFLWFSIVLAQSKAWGRISQRMKSTFTWVSLTDRDKGIPICQAVRVRIGWSGRPHRERLDFGTSCGCQIADAGYRVDIILWSADPFTLLSVHVGSTHIFE